MSLGMIIPNTGTAAELFRASRSGIQARIGAANAAGGSHGRTPAVQGHERLGGGVLVALGEGIDASAISATYENGVLTVTIPLAERAKPRKIDVAHGGGQRSIEPTTVDSG